MARATRIAIVFGVGLGVSALAAAGQAQTVKREPIKPVSGVAGATTFKAYCAQCHGIGGKGDGPAAKALKIPPADLTQISKRHEGKFPADLVKQTVTGENVIAAHGTRDMPMWGPVLRSVDDRATTELRLNNLLTYLESIQEK